MKKQEIYIRGYKLGDYGEKSQDEILYEKHVICFGDKVIGAIHFEHIEDQLKIHGFDIFKQYQNKGYARKTIEYLRCEAIKYDGDIKKICLDYSDIITKTIWEKIGFENIGGPQMELLL